MPTRTMIKDLPSIGNAHGLNTHKYIRDKFVPHASSGMMPSSNSLEQEYGYGYETNIPHEMESSQNILTDYSENILHNPTNDTYQPDNSYNNIYKPAMIANDHYRQEPGDSIYYDKFDFLHKRQQVEEAFRRMNTKHRNAVSLTSDISCQEISQHIKDCDVCSKLYNSNTSMIYILIIVGLLVTLLFALKMIYDLKS